jgi:hypothetical protein
MERDLETRARVRDASAMGRTPRRVNSRASREWVVLQRPFLPYNG